MVSQHGTPEEKATVRAKVKKKFPDIQQEEVELDERLGGKGYSRQAAASSVYPGKKGTGDWEDSDRGAGNKAARRAGKKVEKKSPTYQAYVLNKEAKEEQGRSDYGKASVRNKRKFGKEGEPAVFDASGERGKMIDQRRAEHKAKRGVKEGVVRPKGQDSDKEVNKATRKAAFRPFANTKPPKLKMVEDKALELVRANIIKKHGKGAIYDPKKKQSPEDKAKVAAERKKRLDADNKAYAARAKKAGFKSTQDYTNVVARYGSEDNYKKGRGLGT